MKYSFLHSWIPILYPCFYSLSDSNGNEHILLCNGDQCTNHGLIITDKTQFDAIINHVHLFDRISSDFLSEAREIGVSVAKNLLRALIQYYPHRHFVVYLQIDNREGMIVRFHTIWEDEPLYFNPNCLEEDILKEKLIIFKS